METKNKQYGLLVPKKKQSTFKIANVFGDDSDEETPKQEINSSLQKSALQAKMKRQTQLAIDKALEVDPTVYEYDSIYDNIQAEKEDKDIAVKQKKDKKPKYIAGLLKAAENRKREDERRTERKVQKEREKEGKAFEDKEVFVTGAYRKKMQEMQELEEKERQREQMEELLDVKKQKDMSGFYRYMLNERTRSTVDQSSESNIKVKEEPENVTVKKEGSSSNSSDSEEENEASKKKSQYQDQSPQNKRHSEHMKEDGYSHKNHSREDRREYNKERSPCREGSSRKMSPITKESREKLQRDRSSKDKRRSPHKENKNSRSGKNSRSDSDGESSGHIDLSEKEIDKERRHKDDDRKCEKSYTSSTSKHKISDSYQKQDEDPVLTKKSKVTDKSEQVNKLVAEKKTTDSALNDAKKRYLARKLAKERARNAND